MARDLECFDYSPESHAKSVVRCLCTIPCLLILLVYLLLFNNEHPSCSIQYFYVPALNKLINSSSSLVFFDLELHNSMNYKSVRYDAVNITFSYHTNTTTAMGKYALPRFHQKKGKKTERRDVALVTGMQPWEEAARSAISNWSTADFRVDLTAKLKFEYFFWYFPMKELAVGGRIKVDDSGKIVGKKPVKLTKSAASITAAHGWGIWFAVACFLFLG